MFHRTNLSECHQSDVACLARTRFEHDNPQPSGHFAVVGTACHAIIENFTREQAEHPGVTPASVIRSTLAEMRADPEMDGEVAEDVVTIMSAAFAPTSKLRLGLPPEPWQVVPEWHWYLDADLQPLDMSCNRCDGRGWTGSPPDDYRDCPDENCKADPTRQPAWAGSVDRLEWQVDAGLTRFYDFKSTLMRESSEDLAGDRQFKVYAVAIMAHFPKVKEVEGYKTFLRHGYSSHHIFVRGEPWHEATRQRMRSEHARRLAALKSDQWPETLGLSCSYCPKLHKCSEQFRARTQGSIPNAVIADRANDYLGVREWLKVTERDLKDHVARTGEPIPLDDGDGTVLGKSPAHNWVLADGQTYETILDGLATIQRGRGATEEEVAAFRVEWFRYVQIGHFPSRAKKALEELMGARQAGLLIEAGGWLEKENAEEWSAWVPPDRVVRVELTPEQLDARLDELLGG